jgi:hypothetical protein
MSFWELSKECHVGCPEKMVNLGRDRGIHEIEVDNEMMKLFYDTDSGP